MKTPTPLKKIEAICSVYLTASDLAVNGTEVYSADEMTGIQALERKYPDKPAKPGNLRCMNLSISATGQKA